MTATPTRGILLAIGFFAMPVGSAKNREWKVGKVLDSSSAKSTLVSGASTTSATTGSTSTSTPGTLTATPTGATVHANSNGRSDSLQTSTTVVHHMTIRDTQLAIIGSDYAYVVDDPYTVSGPLLRRAISNRKHGCRFIIGEDIKYIQEKGKLIVLDPDGKECRLDIVKQERVRP